MKEWKTVFLLFLVGFGFRILLYFFFSNEIIAGPDQMQEIGLGRKFASGDFYGVLDTYWAPVYPILIGFVSYFINSPVLPAILISIVAGSLVVPLTYVLVRQSYGRREALIASIIAVFFPHLINSVFAIGSENVYILWILGVLIVGWRAITSGSITFCLLTGILLGLAYLTRPEAFGYPIYFVLAAIVYNFWQKKSFIRNSLPQVAALLLGFSLLAAPYIFYLRGETGEWVVSGKAKINTIAAEMVDDPESDTHEPISAKESVGEFLKYFLLNLIDAHKVFPILLPSLLLLFVGLGLFYKPWGSDRFERETYLILFCVITLMGYAAAVVQVRYFYILLPIFFGWIARGVVQFSQWLQDSAESWTPRKASVLLNSRLLVGLCIAAIYLYVFPLNFYTRSTARAWETRGYEERSAGLWLKQNGKPEPFVFSASTRPVFYAEGKQLPPKTTDVGEILAEIKDRKVDYIVTSERSLKRNPFLKGFDEILHNDPQFELVYDNTPHEGYRISIFKLK